MSNASRVSASEVKGSVESGSTLLVCAYDDDAKFHSYHLEGAIPLSKFKQLARELDRSRQIVFYCA